MGAALTAGAVVAVVALVHYAAAWARPQAEIFSQRVLFVAVLFSLFSVIGMACFHAVRPGEALLFGRGPALDVVALVLVLGAFVLNACAVSLSLPILSLRRRVCGPSLAFAALGVLLQGAVMAWAWAYEGPFVPGPDRPSLLLIPYLVLGVPTEELVYRCGLPVALLALFGLQPDKAGTGHWAGAIFFSGLAFELMHLPSQRLRDPAMVFRAIAFCGLAGWSVYRWRSIYPAMAMHMAVNLCYFALWWWMQWPLGYPPGGG